MRRLMSIAAFALVLALPLWAQRGGGRAGGGHAGGFGGGHAGFGGVRGGFSGGHAGFGGVRGGFGGGHGGFGGGHIGGGRFGGHFGGPRSGPIASRGFSHHPPFSRSSFSHRGFGHHRDHDRDDRFRFFFRNNCFGFGCWGVPWWGYYSPWWWDWDSNSSYDDDYERNLAIANQMNQQSLDQQRMWRQEDADSDQDAYARSAPPASSDPQPAPLTPATVLVFRDQHKEEIRNYAIVGQTLWNFAAQRTEKIPLAQLDLPATEKANDDLGLTFRVPSSNEAQ